MEKKVCVFVDGENFRFAIIDLFKGVFNREDHLPKKANWGTLFDWMVDKVSNGLGTRLRTYWYVIQHVDYFPYKLPDPSVKLEVAKKLLSEHKPYKEELDKLTDQPLIDKLKEFNAELDERKIKMRTRFDAWTFSQDNIAKQHDSIEFRRAGGIRYRLFDKTFGKEKAVDVKLATDLIMLGDIYDIAVIVSGDQDYVPAVQAIKDRGKKVVNVSFKTRGGQLLPGGAKRLNEATDSTLALSYDELKPYLFPTP
jgi:uncharacterized LabA/DUF88 family protein